MGLKNVDIWNDVTDDVIIEGEKVCFTYHSYDANITGTVIVAELIYRLSERKKFGEYFMLYR